MNDAKNRSAPKPQKEHTIVARLLTTAIQKLLSHDAQTVKKLKPFAGKKIRLNIEPVNLALVLMIENDTIVVSTNHDIEVDTTISGKPSALFAMSTNQHIPGLDGVSITGDASFGQFIADILKNIKPDWEDAWCELLGEGPGYQVSQLIKSIKKTGVGFLNSIKESSKDYLMNENRELVSAEEMEDYLNQVDDLKSDTVRLERKIAQLKQAQ